MPKKTTMPEIISVQHQDEVDAICRECRSEGRFAFDTEFVMEDRFEPELCLVQMASLEHVAIIDPFRKFDLKPVWALLHDRKVETIVHAGQEDLAICVQHSGKVPRNIFDTQIAAGLAGHDYPLSLQNLVQAMLHIRLHKSKTLTDWRRRPLAAAHIGYGAEDVGYLLPIRQKIGDRLKRSHRVEWALEEFSRFEDISLYKRADEEKLTRVRGSGSLRGRQLAVLRDLLAWREDVAEELNRPIRALLKDHLLVEIAKHEFSGVREIRDLRGLNLSDKHVRGVSSVVKKAKETPTDQWPQPSGRSAETPGETALVALMTGMIRGHCLERHIAYSLLATKRSIREVIRHCTPPESNDREGVELLNGWRGEAAGALLEEILGGKRSIRVEQIDGKPSIRTSARRGQKTARDTSTDESEHQSEP